MRYVIFALVGSAAFAQTAAISGKIMDEFGEAVAGASVQAKDATGKEFKATSAATGEYTIDQLSPGDYDVTVTAVAMKTFVKKRVAIGGPEASRVDIKLADGDTLGTLGDGDRFSASFFAALKRPSAPTGPTPRLPDGKPDLSGFWVPAPNGVPSEGARQESVDPLPWAEAIRQERRSSNLRDDPYGRCLPRGIMSWAGQGKFVYTSSILVLLSTGEPARQIFLDGRSHPAEVNPTWQGHSVGHWEGEALVVDTVGFNGLLWYSGGLPGTEMLHITERYRRTDLGHLESEIIVEDSAALRKPWAQKRISNLAPTEDILEYICTENNKDVEHMVGK